MRSDLFCSRPAVSISSTSVPSARARSKRLVGDAGRVGADLLGDDLRADAPAPHFELIDGCGAERIGGGEHDARALCA